MGLCKQNPWGISYPMVVYCFITCKGSNKYEWGTWVRVLKCTQTFTLDNYMMGFTLVIPKKYSNFAHTQIGSKL